MPPSSEWTSLVPAAPRSPGAARETCACCSRPATRCCCRSHTPPWGRRERAFPLSHRPLGAAAANARLLLHDGLRRGRSRPGRGPADPRVPQADPRRETRRRALSRARARGLRMGAPRRHPRRRDRAGPRVLWPASLPGRTGSSCGQSGARSDACSGSVIATCRPRGREFRAYFERTVEQTLSRTAAVEEVLDALAHPAPPELSRGYRPLWSLTSSMAAASSRRPRHRRAAARGPCGTVSASPGAAVGSSSCEPSAARCAPPHR